MFAILLPIPPRGGDVFWGSKNRKQASGFKFHKWISIVQRLFIVFNRKDYMCAMEVAEIESRATLWRWRSTGVRCFMVNLIFYTMKYGGNTNRK